MEKVKQLLERVDIRTIISKDFELRDFGSYSKGIIHDSLVVDHNKNYFYWNSLELRGNAFDWLTNVKGMPVVEAIKTLKELAGELPPQREFEYPLEINIWPKLMDIFYELGKTNRSYWYSKKYSDNTIDKFHLGFTSKYYVIPVVFGEKLLNFQCKIPATETSPKKIFGWASGLGVLPFNFDILKDTKSVFITESPGSVISLSQYGFNAVSQTGGASNWLKFWNQYFTHIEEIIIIYDNDKSGLLGSTRLAKQFEDRVKVFVWPDEFRLKYGADDLINDKGKQEFLRLVLNNSHTLKEIEPYKNLILKYYSDREKNASN